ncbi:MAG: chorismate-binding protein [Motiliproteus sp.]
MEGFNRAITTAIDNLCRQLSLRQWEHSTAFPVRLEQPVVLPVSAVTSGSQNLENMIIAQWLAQQPHYPKFYWHGRDETLETACLGQAQHFTGQQAVQQLNSGRHYLDELRYYWLSGFDPDQTNAQHDTQPLLFLPQIELRAQSHPEQNQRQLTLSVILAGDSCDKSDKPADPIDQQIEGLISQLRQLRPLTPPATQQRRCTAVAERLDSPGFDQWQFSVDQAKHAFRTGLLQKVVLARQTQLYLCDEIISGANVTTSALHNANKIGDNTGNEDASDSKATTSQQFWGLFQRWRECSVNSYQIAYQTSPERGFISLTPERLFARQGAHLKTEALAATLPRSGHRDRARHQARELLNDSKSRHEHGLVAVEIGAKLEGLGVQLSHGCGTSLLKQNGIQHLHQVIEGQLPSAQMDAQLFSTLHPTAAVGGLPTKPAQHFIEQHEPFLRGYYAGCCGYFEADHSELAVTIRSADVNGRKLTLYAGAGIVPQSEAAREWRELDQKIALPLSLLDQRPEPASGLLPTHQQSDAGVI